MAELAWYEYIIFSITLLASLGIGIYFAFSGQRQRTVNEYLLGNRMLSPFPVAASIVMSTTSTVTLLGSTAEMYTNGINRFASDIWVMLGMLLSIIYVPIFYKLQITSLFEYCNLRYNSRSVEVLCALMSIIRQIFYVGIVLFGPATAIASVTDIPYWVTLLVSGAIGIIYTTIGGMKTVVWTDFLQGIIMVLGLIVIIIMGCYRLGGIDRVVESAYNSGRLSVRLGVDPLQRSNLWAGILYGVNLGFTFGSIQTCVQRYVATRSVGHAKMTLWLTAPLAVAVIVPAYLCGMVVFAHYDILGCDPLETRQIRTSNQLLPYFIVASLKVPCLPGLLFSAIFSAALSTLSSSMGAMATVTWKHFLERPLHELPEKRKTLITKVLAAIYGCLGLAFAFIVRIFGGNFLQLFAAINGGTAAPLIGTVLLGALFPFANWKGALAGAAVSFPFMATLALGNSAYNPHGFKMNATVESCWKWNISLPTFDAINVTQSNTPEVPVFFQISPMLYGTLGLCIFMFVGITVSLLTGTKEARNKDSSLFIRVRGYGCCFNELKSAEKSHTATHGLMQPADNDFTTYISTV